MKAFITKHGIPLIAALIVVPTIIPTVDVLHKWFDNEQPIEWLGVKVITPEIRPGEILELEYEAIVHKQCMSEIRGFYEAPDGTVPVRNPVVNGGYAMPSEEAEPVKVKLLFPKNPDPGQIPFVSGEYKYKTIVTRYCPNNIYIDYTTPPAKFHLKVD